MKCLGCKKPSKPKADGNKFFPFCSERCQMADLGRWLGEEYRIPDETSVPLDEPDAN